MHATVHKAYVTQARIPGGLPRRGIIDQHVETSIEDARRKAVEMIDRIQRNLDPVPAPMPTEASSRLTRYSRLLKTLGAFVNGVICCTGSNPVGRRCKDESGGNLGINLVQPC